jgi:hypothetical protein
VSVYVFDHVYKFMFHQWCPCEFDWFSLENLVNTHHLLPFMLSVEASMLWVACHSWSSDQKELPHRIQLLTKILLLNMVNLALIFTTLKPQTVPNHWMFMQAQTSILESGTETFPRPNAPDKQKGFPSLVKIRRSRLHFQKQWGCFVHLAMSAHWLTICPFLTEIVGFFMQKCYQTDSLLSGFPLYLGGVSSPHPPPPTHPQRFGDTHQTHKCQSPWSRLHWLSSIWNCQVWVLSFKGGWEIMRWT